MESRILLPKNTGKYEQIRYLDVYHLLWRPDGFYYPSFLVSFFGLAPLLACVAFFLAGLRTVKKTGRVEMGPWRASGLRSLFLF